MNLRPYQTDALDKSLERLQAGVNRQAVVMATGLGKAVLFASLRAHHAFQKRVMVLVHREELAQQAADKIHRWNPGLLIGTEMASDYARPMDTHVVASVPTLGRKLSKRLGKFDPADFDCIVSDEMHHAPGEQWTRVLAHFGLDRPGSRLLSLGLTATPNRSDGVGLRHLFDEIIYDMGIDRGIADGYLVDLACWRISTSTNLDSVHTRAGDFAQDELGKEVNTPKRNALIVKAWAQYAKDKRTVAFTVNVQHALDLAEAFKALGVPSEAVWGEDTERANKLLRHRAGEIDVLCNCAVLTEGYDDPGLECIVLAKPTKSPLLLTQMIGRGTRLPEGCGNISEVGPSGKRSCLLLDVADLTSKHNIVSVPSLLGLPTALDMKGQTYRVTKQKIERIAKAFPQANLADLKSMESLEAIAHQVRLFEVKYPVEIKRLTGLAWRQQGDGYFLPVERGRLTLGKDLLGEWWVRGKLGDKQIEIHSQNLAGAFNAADAELSKSGNRGLYARDARWRDAGPSAKQVELCRKLGIQIPEGARRGQISAALDAHFFQRRGAVAMPEGINGKR